LLELFFGIFPKVPDVWFNEKLEIFWTGLTEFNPYVRVDTKLFSDSQSERTQKGC
jgi:hypothetical protein